ERIRRQGGGRRAGAGAGLAARRNRHIEPDDEPGEALEGGAAREACVVMSHGLALQKLCGVVNRSADADISRAATEVAIHGRINVAVARPLDFLEQTRRTHDLPRLAITALRHIVVDPGSLDRILLASSQSLDGRDLAVANPGYRHRAGAQRLTVEKNRAGPALVHSAPELGAGQVEIVSKDPKQGRVVQD